MKALPGLPINVVVDVDVVGTTVVGGSVVGTPVVGTPVVGTPVVGTAVLVVGTGVVVGGAAVVLVLVVAVVGGDVVELPPHTKPPPGEPSHASQQLVVDPTHVTPLCASHSVALGSISHSAAPPLPCCRQHVTASGRPHVDCAAQDTTSLWHSLGSEPAVALAFATPTAHRTKSPWVLAVAQPHSSSAAARAAATAASSSHVFAAAVPGKLATNPNATTPNTNDLMSFLPSSACVILQALPF